MTRGVTGNDANHMEEILRLAFARLERRPRSRRCSQDCLMSAEAEEKFPPGGCDRLGKSPSFARMGALWGTSDLVNMGYSAACLQGDRRWPSRSAY
jgi:hypothetical protein